MPSNPKGLLGGDRLENTFGAAAKPPMRMRQSYLLMAMLFIQITAWSQSEAEPNNGFDTPNVLLQDVITAASLGSGDTADFFRFHLNSNASLYVYLQITNTASSGAGSLQLSVFNTLRINGEYKGNIHTGGYMLNAGSTFYDTLRICGEAIDSFYLRFKTTAEFAYTVKWSAVNSYPDDGFSNNTFATASPFTYNTESQGSIRYKFWGGSNFDTTDYFTTVLPVASYDTVMLNLTATNTSCTSGQWIKYSCYKNNSSELFAEGYIGNNAAVDAGQVVSTVIPLDNMVPGDVLFMQFSASAAFGYSFRVSGEFGSDTEDNCCLDNALPIAENQIVTGNVGEYNYDDGEFVDEYDMYRIILPQSGSVRFFVKSRNDQCIESGNSLYGEMLDKNGSFLIGSTALSTWAPGVDCGTVRNDTIKFRAFAADTFYLRLRSNNKVSYHIRYEHTDISVTDAPESYNAPVSAVIPISEREVKKGHIRFRKTISQTDASDIYRITMPADGNIAVYVKAVYRDNASVTNSSTANRLSFAAPNFTDRTPSNPPVSTLLPDAEYIDTMFLCPLVAGDNLITISSSRPYEYEFYYEIRETTAGQNDPEPNNFFLQAIPVSPNETKTGRLRYFEDRQGSSQDQFDYYKYITPYKGRLKVYVQATNTQCTPGTAITLTAYKDTLSAGLMLTRNLGNLTSNIPAGAIIYDTVYTCRVDPDTLYLRLQTTSPYRYQFRFEFLVDTAADSDPEPDNGFDEAIRIGSGQNQLRYLGKTYSPGLDINDYMKMVVPGPDTLRLHWQATNIGCLDNKYFRIYGYNKNHNQIFFKGYILNAVGIIDAGQSVADSLKEYIAAMDTVYIRLNADGYFRYNIQTNPVKPSNWFIISGDSTPCTGGLYTYKITNLVDSNVTFHWSLPNGGGTLNYTDSIATVTWETTGTRSIRVYVSNSAGSSLPRTMNVIINGVFPSQTPVAVSFARKLSTNSLPPGANCQWYRNDTLISGATDSTYYAADAGTYFVKFVNDCGAGPASNAITFDDPAIPQTITFPHTANVTMAPALKIKLGASTDSGLPVYYQKISGPGNIINDTLYITGTGIFIVKATQPGDDVYRPAVPVNDTVTIIKGSQVITFDTIPDQFFDAEKITLLGSSSSGLGITYTITTSTLIAGVSGNKITKKGVGTVTVRASQNGNANYNAASPVERTFCIGVRVLTPILGQPNPCLATYSYTTQKIPGANYVWTLSGGGVLTTHNDTAFIQWQTAGAWSLNVKANSPCDAVYTDEQELVINTSEEAPAPVGNMLPANNSIDQQLPLKLSWIPGPRSVSYDLYVWDSAAAEPSVPYAANLTNLSYTLPLNSFAYNNAYKWKIVSRNPCSQTSGAVQQFRLIPLADLTVSDIQAPLTANSGQNITINWTVKNMGPGKTRTDEQWRDAVFLTFDTTFNKAVPPQLDAHAWSGLDFPLRPLLIGTKPNVSALDSGASYSNSLSYTLPVEYSQPYYVYVITNYPAASSAPLQVSYSNDTMRAAQPMVVTLSPTPDLRVDSVFTTASAFSGNTVNLTYKVKNYGVVTPAGSQWIDSIFISQSPLFDRSTAIPLNLRKANDSYYPNASGATVSNSTQLPANGSYAKSIEAVIPNFIFGTWFIYVQTNAITNVNSSSYLYEGALSNNNLNRSQLEIFLTPTPKLTVNNLVIPVTTASVTQTIGANWVIKNEGFTDNLEKNKGHNLFHLLGHCPCHSSGGTNTSCVGPPKYEDSLSLGSSYWVDRVYFSTDPGGLNTANATLLLEVKHGTQQFSGVLYPEDMDEQCGAHGSFNTQQALNPGASFATDGNIKIPSDLQPGTYYIYVYTNPAKTVFEYPGTPQIKRSTLPITIQRPDASVPSVTAPASSVAGQTITINYAVLNNGPGGVFNHQRKDRLYISNFSNFDINAQLVSTQAFTEDLLAGDAVQHSFIYNIPSSTTGTKYFFVETNYDSSFRETNMLNNLSAGVASTMVTIATPADMVVNSVQPADSVFTLFPSKIRYTVTNNGLGTTVGDWTDSLFISCGSSFNASTSYYIGKKSQTRIIAPGASYTDSVTVNMPLSYEINNCFPEQMYSTAYVFVKTNADNGTYEGPNISNNVNGSSSRVLVNPLVDQIVTTVAGPDMATVGFAYPVDWRVKNAGYNPNAVQYYNSWYDGIYFSADSIADGGDKKAGDYLKYLRLNRNQDSADHRSPILQDMPGGDYYVYVKTNSSESIRAEKILSNNVNFIRDASGAAKKINVIRPPLADLTDSIVFAPASIAVGQPLTIIYKVTNTGNGPTSGSTSWKNEILLSSDFLALPNTGDKLLSTRTRNGVLLPGEFYYDTVTVTISSQIVPGNYVLISEANTNSAVVESNITNNLGYSLLDVYSPPSVDLTVSNIISPDTAYLGYTIDTVKWKVSNISPNIASGNTSDGIYLSTSTVLDSTAVLVGTKSKNINMMPLATDSMAMRALVMDVTEGNYNIIVKTDLRDNIVESDKGNNEGVSLSPIYVKVKELPVNVLLSANLRDTARYYKLIIPDSLRRSTIRVTLKSSDSLTKLNEMFIASAYIPSPARFDYNFEIPNYGNQQIVMTSAVDSVYYIMVRCVSHSPGVQNITLKAEKLPFAILAVNASSGGNSGNVTVKINGSLFTQGMTAKLGNAGSTIHASAVYFTNTTQVYATFNLQGKPLGIYDVTLSKGNTATAVLPGSFSIVTGDNGGLITGSGPNTGAGNGNGPGCDPGASSGLNSQLVTELIVPSRIIVRWPFIIQVNYSNPTNSDIPAQTRILYTDGEVKIAFTAEEAINGSSSLYLELTEPGGPPGIIRAGASGTITIYARAPDTIPNDPTRVHFKLQ